MFEMLGTYDFWVGLAKIIGVNVVLSGDNAVVIALAARSLPVHQQKKAVMYGAGAAILMRVVLTIFAVQLLTLPWLKLIGSLLLFWIGVKLLAEEDGDENIESSDNLVAAIKTILIADLVMSLDNVIAVAAAAGGSTTLLILGLAISIPLVIFGATLLLNLMERYPVIITIGAALIGLVAGEMLVADIALRVWEASMGVTFGEDNKPRVGGLSLELIAGVLVPSSSWSMGSGSRNATGPSTPHARRRTRKAAPRFLTVIKGDYGRGKHN
jgi:YjbE family integral membrane protein